MNSKGNLNFTANLISDYFQIIDAIAFIRIEFAILGQVETAVDCTVEILAVVFFQLIKLAAFEL